MSFHKREHLVRTAVNGILRHNGALADDIARLEQHYMHDLSKPQPCYLAAVAILLAAPDVQTAMKDVSEKLQVTHLQGENYMREGINAAPDWLKAREEFLHNKGIMRGRERYFVGLRNIAPGSVYDRAWQMGDAATRTILAEAVQASQPIKGRTLGYAEFNYVVALLIPAGQERDFALNRLSLTHKRTHDSMIQHAVGYIRDTAREGGLAEPAGLPVAAPAPVLLPSRSVEASSPLPKTSGAAAKATRRDIFVPAVRSAKALNMHAQPSQGESSHVLRDPDEVKRLKRDLDVLKSQEKIGESAGRLYLWLHTEGKNGERTISQAAEVLKKPENVVRIMVSQVGRALHDLRGGDDLEGQGHQSRPVSP